MFRKTLDTTAPIDDLLANRWSGVAFDPERPVSDEIIRTLAEAARWAPSCYGNQPWRYIICNRGRDEAAWHKAWDCLAEGNRPWTRHAPVLIITCCETLFSHNDKPNAWCEYDSGAASLSICVQAAALDLMTHQMAGFDPARARESFAIPERYKPLAMMALGYQLPRERIPDQFRGRELAPRRRNPLERHFFLGAWGEGLK